MEKMRRRVSAIILGLVLMLQLCAVAPAEARDTKASLKKAGSQSEMSGDYAQGQVIVKYRAGTLASVEASLSSNPEKKLTKSLKQARKSPKVSSKFGASEHAVMSAGSLVNTIDAQTDILSSEIKDYVIEDTVDFSDVIPGKDAPVYSLVSSEKYTSDELIKLLSDNPDVVSVTKNEPIRCESMDYTMNDTYANYMTHLNSAAYVNTIGRQADNRGYASETLPTLNAAYAWEKSDKAGVAEKPVVAVVDSGIDTTHEDLIDSLWTNPGNIGLLGKHGYNFIDDSEELKDGTGHGTHCAGIIAAGRNNGLGTSGVASGMVQLMGLRILGDDGATVEGRFNGFAAYQYILKAKKNGVNITVCSNSWGGVLGYYDDMDEILQAMGDAGILFVISAGNDNQDMDHFAHYPSGCYSDYSLRVGSVSEDGKKAAYSNYGNHSVDLFAQGNNILSSVSYDCYYPAIYTPDVMQKTTSFYGEYSRTMASGDMAPVLGDDGYSDYTGVGTFGKPVLILPSGVTADLAIGASHAVNSSKNPAVLDLTLHGVTPGSDCYLYYPYEKSKYDDGTCFDYSVGYLPLVSDPYSSGSIMTGDFVRKKDGTISCPDETKRGFSMGNNGIERHLVAKTIPYSGVNRDDVASYGIGFRIHTNKTSSGEVRLQINHIAVSKESASEYYGKYDNFSGTSMACPVAAGVAGWLSAMEPAGSEAAGGTKGSDYVGYLKNRLFAMTKHSENLEGKCLSEGYLDFTLLDGKQPVISDVKVDAAKNTITLTGANLKQTGESKLFSKRLIGNESYQDISAQATWSKDGKSVVIKKAGDLISTYTRFMVTNDGGSGVGAFFLVKGERSFEKIGLNPDNEYIRLLTDAKKKRLLCIDDSLDLSEWDEKTGFEPIEHEKSEGLLRRVSASAPKYFDSLESLSVDPTGIQVMPLDAVTVGDKICHFLMLTGRDEQQMVMATLDLNRTKTIIIKKKNKKTKKVKKIKKKVFQYHWKLTPVKSPTGWEMDAFVIGKTIYAIPDNEMNRTADALDKNIYRLKNGEWIPTGVELPEDYFSVSVVTYKNKAYFMAGAVPSGEDPTKAVPSVQILWKDSSSIYCFDGKKITKKKTELPTVFRHVWVDAGRPVCRMVFAESPKGILIYGASMDGYGNTACYNPEKDTLQAIPATIEPGIASDYMVSAVTTNKGFFVSRGILYHDDILGNDFYRLRKY